MALADAIDHRIVCVTGNLDENQERRALETLLSLGVDGVIIGSGRLASEHIAAVAERIPTVVIGRDAPGAHADVVRPDARQMANVLAAMAAEHGHDRATLLTFAETLSAAPGTEAILRAFEERGVLVDSVPGHYDYAPTARVVQQLIDRDALNPLVIALGNGAAFGVYNVLLEGGRHVPRDTSLLTYDVGVPDERLVLALSGTAQDISAMADAAWKLLLERMQDPSLEPRLQLVPGIVLEGQTITSAP